MSNREFIDKIQARQNYKAHTCLDGGRNIFIVLTTNNEWFYYNDGKWLQISHLEAKDKCKAFYFEYRYEEMLKEQ